MAGLKFDPLGSFTSSNVSGIDASFVSMVSSTSSGSSGYEIESEVGREALKEICCSALSRVLDFPGSQLETLLGHDDERGDRAEEDGGTNVAKNIAASFKVMKHSLGSALAHGRHHHHKSGGEDNADCGGYHLTLKFKTALTSDNQGALLQLITHAHSFIVKEGLFRKPGNKARMHGLIRDLSERGMQSVLANASYKPHDYASVIKQYFSELPEPVLLKRHLNAYLQTADLSSPLRSLQLLMLMLPPSHRIALQHLLELLSQVARHHHETKMDAHNLALVFAPTLFFGSRTDSIGTESLKKLTSLLKFMIENCEEIFEVPAEVQVVAERYCRKMRNRQTHTQCEEETEDLPLYTTYCSRVSTEEFHSSGQDHALAEVASLLETVQKMPDGPQKTHFLKMFESSNKLAPTPTPKKSWSIKKHKENATPRVKLCEGIGSDQLLRPCFKKGSLMADFELAETPQKKDTHVQFRTPLRASQTPGSKRAKMSAAASRSPRTRL